MNNYFSCSWTGLVNLGELIGLEAVGFAIANLRIVKRNLVGYHDVSERHSRNAFRSITSYMGL